jgi:hypothetical protein
MVVSINTVAAISLLLSKYHHYLLLFYSVVKVGVCFVLHPFFKLFSDLLKLFEKLRGEEMPRQKLI